LLYISSEISKLSGYQSSDFINNHVRTFESLIYQEDRKRVNQLIEDSVQKHMPWEFEYRIIDAHNNVRWVFEKGQAIFDKENKVDFLDGFILDITERKIAENALKENELRYRTLFENAQIGIYQTTPKGQILSSNPALIEMLGYDSFEELSKINLELNEGHADNSRNIFLKLMSENGLVKDLESKWKTKKGETIIIVENARAVKDLSGKIIYFEGFIENITNRKKIENELRQSELTFKNLVGFAPYSIFVNDFAGNFLMVNNAFTKDSGYSQQELIGKTIKELSLDFDKETEELIRQELYTNIKVENIETFFIDRNGKRVDVYYSCQIMQLWNKPVILSSTINITDRKRTELELAKYRNHLESIVKERTEELLQNVEELKLTQESLEKSNSEMSQLQLELLSEKQLIDALMGSIPDAIYFKDLDSRFLKTSKSMQAGFYKINDLDMIGKSDFDYFTDEHAIQAFNDEQKIIKTGIPIIDLVEKETWKDGSITFSSTTKMPLRDVSGNIIGTFGVSRDITKIIEMEAKIKKQNEDLISQQIELELALNSLEQTQDQLIHSEKMASLGVLAAGVAHEINNPLNFINGGIIGLESYFNENLKEHLKEVSPLINGIQTGVSRAAAIVTSLNHYSRRDDLPVNQCDIHSIIDNCLIMLQSETKNRIKIIKNLSKKNHHLNCNESKLHQAFLNILANAYQSIENNGSITISTKTEKNKFHITFSDTGCGISKENLTKIMDPFFTTKEPGKGTGLGLAITYNIITELNGTIEIDSNENLGTKVTVCLPLS